MFGPSWPVWNGLYSFRLSNNFNTLLSSLITNCISRKLHFSVFTSSLRERGTDNEKYTMASPYDACFLPHSLALRFGTSSHSLDHVFPTHVDCVAMISLLHVALPVRPEFIIATDAIRKLDSCHSATFKRTGCSLTFCPAAAKLKTEDSRYPPLAKAPIC